LLSNNIPLPTASTLSILHSCAANPTAHKTASCLQSSTWLRNYQYLQDSFINITDVGYYK
jgi:hypothetical protein